MGAVRRYDPTTVKQLRCRFLLFSYTSKSSHSLCLSPGFSFRKHRPEEVKMLKFPTLLFLFLKIGNPCLGRRSSSAWEHFYDAAAAAGLPDSAAVRTPGSSNSRKWSFPHRAPDIKLLTVAIWRARRGTAQWFHFTVQILSPHSVCPSLFFSGSFRDRDHHGHG